MAEKHVKYALGTTTRIADMMWCIYQFVLTSGQTAVRFADNNVLHAVYNGTAYATPTSSTDFPTGSFIVLESSATMPSGHRWQVKFSRTTAVYSTLSTVGGWDYLTNAFTSSGGSTPPGITPPVTDTLIWSATGTGTTAQLLISSSDLDTYGASAISYSYISVHEWFSTTSEGVQFLNSSYVGGYVPTNMTNNTNPVCILARVPSLENIGGAPNFGANSVSLSECRIAPDYNFATTTLNQVASYAFITSVSADNGGVPGSSNYAKDLLGGGGQWVNFPVYVVSGPGAAVLGYFGKYTMFGGYSGRVDATPDTANEYVVINDLVFRWKPSA